MTDRNPPRKLRVAARLSLAVVLILGGVVLLPRPASRIVVPDALADLVPQPTPTLPDILKSPEPTEPPSGGGGGGKEGGGKGGGGSGGGGGGKEGDGKDGGGKKAGKKSRTKDGKGKLGGLKKNKKKRNKKKGKGEPAGSIAGRIPGAYNTNKLVAVAAHLRALGVSQEEVVRRVYPPFIIAGPASWVDTWGAPRYGPGPIVRTHEGQDVFCNYGDPVLAPTDGVVDFSNGGLGGITARVHETGTGRYWYLTHLSDVNTEQFQSGDRVGAGDVVGFCGNSGNALTTPPHVHFGWYAEGGVKARNPMRSLIRWLRTAERRVLGEVTKTTKKRVEQQPTLTAARRFGDAFTPDLSELRISGESLWASGSDPASGAVALAESVLQAALSGASRGSEQVEPVDLFGAGTDLDDSLDPKSALAQFLGGRDSAFEGSD